MVRPKLKPSARLAAILKIRLTVADKKAFEEAAALEHMDLSTFARMSLIEKARRLGIKI